MSKRCNILKLPTIISAMDILLKGNVETTNYVISQFKGNPTFIELAKKQAQLILQRDDEDGTKLQNGVNIGIERGTLSPLVSSPQYTKVNVLNKSPDDVCAEIISSVGSAADSGSVIVVVGLSGVGKGTTVQKLAELLPNCITWSNGNIFRCFTLLATKFCAKNNLEITIANLEPQIEPFLKCLSFVAEKQDIRVESKELDVSFFVEDVKNTELKGPEIGRNIPLVASLTQGEAVCFAKTAIDTLQKSGKNVLLEGRQQTVDFIDSPHRFELVLPDMSAIGERRVAQVIAAKAAERLKSSEAGEEKVMEVLNDELKLLNQ